MKVSVKKYSKYLVLSLIILVSTNFKISAQDKKLTKIISLHGLWSFSVGEREEWKQRSYNDTDWEKIRVPSSWEDQGFHGYNGYGTYRKKVFISSENEGQMLYLMLGYIDDVDEVYFNGTKIGSTGTFPPHYRTAYNADRKYYIPEELIKYDGRNLITVKVYDAEQAGGIVSGNIGIYSSSYGLKPEINLQGSWKFKLGDNFERKRPDYNDVNWDKIFVPSKWEDQGFKNYDGYAWYRKTFTFSTDFTDENLIVVLGKIDDCDQVYINGQLVGTTGEMPKYQGKFIHTSDEFRAFRGYYFPSKLLKKNSVNTIAVRVFDRVGEGGIYEGPVGIVSQTNYIKYWRKRKNANKW